MPHLEFQTFAGQLFWLLISFSTLYFLAAKFLLPNVAKVVGARAETISGDINSAETAKDATIAAQEKHHNLLDKATAEARQTLDEAMKKAEENIASKRKELKAQLDKSLAQAEKKIAEIEAESANIVSKVSGDIAKVMAEKAAA